MRKVYLLGNKVVVEQKGQPYKEYNFQNEIDALQFYFLMSEAF